MLGIFDLLSFNVPKLKDLKAVPGQKNGYKFSSKFQTYKKVPAAFLQLNQRELSAFYRSAAGGKRILTEYGLNMEERTTLS